MAIAQEWEQREKELSENQQRQSRRTYGQPEDSGRAGGRLANGLGWFSIGLGLAEVAAPAQVAQLIGIGDDGRNRALLRFYGLREIAAGVGILSQPNPAGWMWSRVAGDLLDLASLGSAMKAEDADKGRLTTVTTAVIGVTALDLYCARQLSDAGEREGRTKDRAVRARKSIIVNRSPEEVYRFWRDLQNLPRFMSHLESVQIIDDRRSHWRAKGPGGVTVEWEAEILEDRPNEFSAWRSLEGADIDNSGSVRFERAPGGRGTVVRVEMEYAPPGGRISAKIARLFGAEPGQEIEQDLRAFKQVMETGEVIKSDASIHRGMHPAQPSAR